MSMSNSQEVLTSSSGTKKRSRVRIVILLLLSVGTMINYLDRTILGIVAPQLTQEIHIDPAMMGIIFSAFAWTYALAQIPGGMFLDRFGNKLTYALSIFFWSLFTLLQSFTLGLKSLLLLRLGLGVSEAPCFPANSRIVSTWFPQHERARATATYTVGEYIGLAAFSPLLFLILEHHGWRTLFFLTGGLGILFTLVWWRFYHEPHESRTANQAELDYIGANGINNKIQNVPFNWRAARLPFAGVCPPAAAGSAYSGGAGHGFWRRGRRIYSHQPDRRGRGAEQRAGPSCPAGAVLVRRREKQKRNPGRRGLPG